jgi:hypothetical protein
MAQQHLSGTWSLSTGIALNSKGGQFSAHYHLNSFDEVRLTYLFTNQVGIELISTTSKINLLQIAYVQGFKFQNIPKAGFYVGGGAFLGKQKINTLEKITKNITGIQLISEMEYAPINWLSFILGLNFHFPFTQYDSNKIQLVFGTRFYF